MAEFSDKVAVITGGARGFGRGFGEALAARGARVLLADIDGPAATEAAREIGANAQGLALDVADNAAIEAAMAAISVRHGGIDILINNAGIHSLAASKPIRQLGLEAARRMFEVNVWGVIQCTLAAAPFMAAREGAAIVNIASMAAYPSASAYGVTKLAVRGITADFARDLAPIRVNAIAPGLIFTDTIRAELPKPIVEAVSAQQIVKREGTVADVVEAMLYLVSPRSGFVTGETLKVTGGVTLQV
jgi:3-oxoacyl-[acyl-carrier protein] reductase